QLYDVPDHTLARWGVLINRRLRALICVACQAIVLPAALSQHIAQLHEDARISIDADRLASIVENESILNDLPVVDGTPVEYAGLETKEGFGCP
ncbi:hypothetical protein BV20DRAFT_916933, partial [Pilatotrama ljubarskyi]